MVFWCLAFITGIGSFYCLPTLPNALWICGLAFGWLTCSYVLAKITETPIWYVLHGAFTAWLFLSLYYSAYYSNWRPEAGAQVYHIEAEVVSVQRPITNIDNNHSQKLMLRLHRVNGKSIAPRWWQPASYIRVSRYLNRLETGSKPVSMGDRIVTTAKLSHIYGFENGAGFDYSRWLFSRSVVATGYVVGEVLQLHGDSSHAQRAYDRLFHATHDSANQGYWLALSLGSRTLIDAEQREALKQLGIGHLLAISGLHIGIIFCVLYASIKLTGRVVQLGLSHQHVLLMALVALWYYIFLLGFAISALRAGLLLTLWILLNLRFAYINRFRLLLLLACVTLIMQPAAILQPGWWLSFVAVLAIFIYLHMVRQNSKPEQDGDAIKDSAHQVTIRYQVLFVRAKQLFLLQLYVGVGLLPVTVFWFGGLSLAGFIVNLLAIPYFSLVIVPLNFFMSLLAVAGSDLASLGFVFLDQLLNAFWWLVNGFKGSMSYVRIPSTSFLLFSLLIVSLLVYRCRASSKTCRNKLKVYALGHIPLLLTLLPGSVWDEGKFSVRVLDVGQGTSVILQQGRSAWLYDLGPMFRSGFNTTDAVVVPMLYEQGISKVDTLVVSHHDSDHLGRPASVLDEFATGQMQDGCRESALLSNQTQYWHRIEWQLIWPRADMAQQALTALNDNDSSCVVRVTHLASGTRVLLSGDIGQKVERQMSKLHDAGNLDLNADILISPHHGSKYSSSQGFINRVAPAYVVHSSGVNNRFNFPTKDVQDRYRLAGVKQMSTRQSGEVQFAISAQEPTTMSVKTALNQWSPFWKRQNPFSIVEQIR